MEVKYRTSLAIICYKSTLFVVVVKRATILIGKGGAVNGSDPCLSRSDPLPNLIRPDTSTYMIHQE